MNVIMQDVAKVWRSGLGHEVVALQDISHQVGAGSFACFLGPSGCGKSTLLEIIAGMVEPSAGHVYGKRPTENTTRRIADHAIMVWQSQNLFPWRTIIDNVSFGLQMRGVPKDKRRKEARRWLSLMGLSGFEYLYPSQLSGGMRQRVALARALILDPEVMLLDEPFGALDAQTKTLMQQELLHLYDQTDKTFLFVTHSIEEAILLGDEVILISARPGRIIDVVNIQLPRPRTYEMTHSPEFDDYFGRIYETIKDEVMRSAAMEAGHSWGLDLEQRAQT